MMQYPEANLGDLIEIFDSRRVPLSSIERAKRPGPFPYYGAAQIFDSIDDFLFDGTFLLVGEDGSVVRENGRPFVQVARGRFWANNHTHVLRPVDGVDFWYLQTAVEFADIRGLITGAAQPKLNQANLRRISLSFPPEPIRNLIGGIASAFFELIENNSRRIEILEAMAQAIYREWFVEFRYPGHEDVPLVDSELGPIPEGWSCRRVDELAEVVRGRSYRKFEVPETGGVPFLNLKCISRGGGFRKSGLKRYTGPFKPSQQAHSGDIVMAVTDMTQERNVVARAARVPSLPEGWGVISLDLARVVPQGTDREYLYGMFRYSSFPEHVKNYASGTNVLHLSADRICEYRFPCADPGTQERYGSIVRPIFELIDHLQSQSEVLQETRDLLLPRLISGEIDVSELDIELAGSSV
jgi:type I restriction enzyme S subunit